MNSYKLNLSEIAISRLDTHYALGGRRFTLEAAFKEIRKGNSTVGRDYGSERVQNDNYKSLTLQEATEKARHYNSLDSEVYYTFKQNLPAYCFGCTLDGRSPDQPTGILGIDLDNIEDISRAKTLIMASPYTFAYFITLGGKGLRVLSKVTPIPTPETHRYAWFAVRNAYKFIAKVDPAGKEINKLSALVYDPEIFVNEKSYSLNWTVDTEAFLSEFPHDEIEQQALSGIPDEYKVAIEELTYKASGWSRERIPCLFKHREGGIHENDGWGYRSNAMEVRKIDGGYEVRCHKCDGRTEQFVANPQSKSVSNRYTPKLSYLPDTEPESDKLHILRSLLKREVLAWERRTRNTRKKHLLILGTGAGTGKSTTTLVNLKQYADISPTIALADEKFEKAIDSGKNAIRHRSRYHNEDAADGLHPYEVRIGLNAELSEVPCAYPAQCNALAQKGYVPSKVFCPSCPHIEKCKKQGYLSQYALMRSHDCVFLSYQDDFFSDPAYAQRINQIAGDKEIVLVLDEPNPADLPPKRGWKSEVLITKSKEYEGVTRSFLTDLLETTASTDEGAEFVHRVKGLLDSNKYRHALPSIDEQLGKISTTISFQKAETLELDLRGNPLYEFVATLTYNDQSIECAVLPKEVTPARFEMHSDMPWILTPKKEFVLNREYGRYLTLKEFCRLGFGNMDNVSSISKLPIPLTNFVSDLQSFVDSSLTNTPACQRTEAGWEYYLKPTMNARRGIMISAGDTEKEIQALYADSGIEIMSVDGNPPEWRDGCELYQISTGRYTPRQSLYLKDTATGEAALRPRGFDFINLILNEAQTGKTVLVVGPKDFTDQGNLTHIPLIAQMLAFPNISVINHHHAEGVNNFADYDTSFIFLYEPIPTTVEQIAKRVYRDADLSFERELVDLEKRGVRLEGVNRYVDSRVQRVYDKEVEKRLMQAITRLRQMLNTDKKCYLLTSEPVSELPVKPIFFTLGEAQACQGEHGTLDKLSEYIQERSKMSVNELAEADDISERTAYRRTKKQRQEAKSEVETVVVELKSKGVSIRKIANELDITRGRVVRILERAELSAN